MRIFLSILLLLTFSVSLFSQENTTSKLDQLIKGYTATGRFNGAVLVASHDRILIDKGYGFKNVRDSVLNDTSTIFQIASLTKQFTSAVILKLVELKKLALTDKLSKYYPGFPKGERITIENLLTHTSGIFDWTRAINFSPAGEQSLLSFLKTKALDFPPGTSWQYSNSNYSLLGYIIQKTTGMSYENAVRRYIFNPLHMTHSGFDFKHLASRDKATGYSVFNDSSKIEGALYDSVGPYAAGEIYSTVGDLFKWHKGLQSDKIISKSSLEKAYIPFREHYGYGWIIDTLYKKRIISHSGDISGFCSNLARITEDNVFIVLLNNKEGSDLKVLTENILAVLYNKPYAIPVKRHPVKLNEDILNKYIGIYEVSSVHGSVFGEVSLRKGKLMLQSHEGQALELIAERENHFFDSYEGREGDVEFVTDPRGRVDKIILSRDGVSFSGRKVR